MNTEGTTRRPVYYYQWLNSPAMNLYPCPMRVTLYGRPCRVFARGTKNSVGIEFIDGLEPLRTVTSRYAISQDPPRPIQERLAL